MGRKRGGKNRKPVIVTVEPVEVPKPQEKKDDWLSSQPEARNIAECLRRMNAEKVQFFFKGDLDESYRGNGMTVRFVRLGQTQYVECLVFPEKDLNLRQIYLFLEHLRLLESHGINYKSLSSSQGSL
jgi:hypothetical protein